MSRFSKVLRASLIVLTIVGVSGAHALEFAPELISTPISNELRQPFAALLRDMGIPDIDHVLDATKVVDVSGPLQEPYLAFRVESSPLFCQAGTDLCITIIGRVIDGSVVPAAMFGAGNRVNFADTISNVGGVRSRLVRFHSRDFIVSVLKTAKGLVVLPQQQNDAPR